MCVCVGGGVPVITILMMLRKRSEGRAKKEVWSDAPVFLLKGHLSDLTFYR